MKTCPYCAEEIKDEAIKCRWCLSWLVSEPPRAAETPPPGVAQTSPVGDASAPSGEPSTAMTEPSGEPSTAMTEPSGEPSTAMTEPIETTPVASAPAGDRVEFTHSGERYLLGYSGDHFGIWDRQSPAQPMERFPRTDDGWREAWQRYAAIETNWMDLRTGQRS